MFIRVMCCLIGLWLFTSAFVSAGRPAPFLNLVLVGILVVFFGVLSILGRHRARRANWVLGLWLFVSALIIPPATWGATVNQIVSAVLVVITALFPHVHSEPARQSA